MNSCKKCNSWQKKHELVKQQRDDLLAACKRWMAAIEHWLETGEPHSAEESESIYNQAKEAVEKIAKKEMV